MPWALRRLRRGARPRDRPLAIVIDDLQWAEAGLVDLLEDLADWTRDASILLIVLARPELLEVRPAWGGGKRSATSICPRAARRRRDSRSSSTTSSGGPMCRRPYSNASETAAEGNPLFVEELLEMLIDEGALARTNWANWTARRDLAALAVPPTIQALLAARLERAWRR